MPSASDHAAPARFPFLQGVLPITTARIPAEIVAGITLAAIAVPEVMGYTKISGTPVSTGLYTMLIPTALFAVFGSSRHLVVGADSATAAILASALVGIAATGSDQYLALAGVLALMAAVFLILARLSHWSSGSIACSGAHHRGVVTIPSVHAFSAHRIRCP